MENAGREAITENTQVKESSLPGIRGRASYSSGGGGVTKLRNGPGTRKTTKPSDEGASAHNNAAATQMLKRCRRLAIEKSSSPVVLGVKIRLCEG